jgi:pre-mRNA-processing factor SLU7
VDNDPRQRTAIRNLRIREDTAKYLRNLDPNSAPYSGKSRTMNENPNPDVPAHLQLFKGDNSAKFSGDFVKYLNQEAFTLEANDAGVEVNHVGMPSQVEIMHREFKVKKELLKQKKMQELLGRYGGEKYLDIPDDIR